MPEETEPNSPSMINALGLLSSYPVKENTIIPKTIPRGVVTENIKHIYATVPKPKPACKCHFQSWLGNCVQAFKLSVGVSLLRSREWVVFYKKKVSIAAEIHWVLSAKSQGHLKFLAGIQTFALTSIQFNLYQQHRNQENHHSETNLELYVLFRFCLWFLT